MGGTQYGQGPQEPERRHPDPYQGYGPPPGVAPPQGYTLPQGQTPQQGYYAWQPGYGPPPMAPVAKKKRRKWPWILLGIAIFLMVLFSCVAGGGEETGSTAGSEGGGTAEEETTGVGVGEVGEVGQWEVTADSVETTTSYNDGFSDQAPQGEFVVVTMTVSNSGGEATTFDEGDVALIDANGNTHSSSSLLFSDDGLFLEQINPGNTVTGEVLFDVPEGTEAASLEVEDSWSFEDPLEIRLN